MCPDRRWARRTASTLLEVAMQSAFLQKCSYTMAVRGLLTRGSVMMRPMRDLAVAKEIGRGDVSVAVSAVFTFPDD